MKTAHLCRIAKITVLLILALLASLPAAQSAVMTNSVVISYGEVPSSSGFVSGWLLGHRQQPGDIGAFGCSIYESAPDTYVFDSIFIAEYYSFFTATPGMEFTADYVLGHAPLFGNQGPNPYTRSFGIGDNLLLAYWDSIYLSGSPSAESEDAYGWFSLTRTTTGFEITSSATAYGSGIYVGTGIAVVPEPTSLAILGLTAALFALRKRPICSISPSCH